MICVSIVERDLARIDLEDEDNSFAYVNIVENRMSLVVETDNWDDFVRVEANYCLMCGINLKEQSNEL